MHNVIWSPEEPSGINFIYPHFVGVETQAQGGQLSNFLWVAQLVD